MRVDRVFDIETIAWTKFYAGGLYDGETVVIHEDEQAMFWALAELPKGTQVWAAGGGKFDFIWLAEHLSAAGIPAMYFPAGERMNRVEVENGPTLLDSYGLIPFALNSRRREDSTAAVDLIARDLSPLDLPCRCLKQCGGYCSIGDPRHRARVLAYLEQDMRDVYDVLDAVIAELDRQGVTVRATQSSTAWATAKAMTPIEPARWASWPHYRFAREAYYGGRNEVYAIEAGECWSYDMRAAYPWALASAPVPHGAYVRLPRDRAAAAFGRRRPGIYRARVEVPAHLYLPPLPWRHRTHVYYPTGNLLGTWTLTELEAAIASGVRIQRIVSAIVWTHATPILKPMIDRLWELRAHAENNDALTARQRVAWSRLYKGISVATVGKLAQRPEGSRIVIHPDAEQIKLCPGSASKTCSDSRCSGYCRRWEPMNRDATIWRAPYWQLGSSAHIQMAAYVNAAVRIELRAQTAGIAPVHAYTDAVIAAAPRHKRLGNGLGEWSEQGRLYRWRCLAAGVYSYHDSDGARHVKAKGLHIDTPEEWDLFAAGEQLTLDRGVKTMAEALRSGGRIFARARRIQTRSEFRGVVSGRLVNDQTLTTYPPTVEQARGWAEGRAP